MEDNLNKKDDKTVINCIINYGTAHIGDIIHYHGSSPDPSTADDSQVQTDIHTPASGAAAPSPDEVISALQSVFAVDGLMFRQDLIPVVQAIKRTSSMLRCKRDAVAMYRIIEERHLIQGGISIGKFCELLTALNLDPSVLPNSGAFKQVTISKQFPDWEVNSSAFTTSRFLEIGRAFLDNMQKNTPEANNSVPDNV